MPRRKQNKKPTIKTTGRTLNKHIKQTFPIGERPVCLPTKKDKLFVAKHNRAPPDGSGGLMKTTLALANDTINRCNKKNGGQTSTNKSLDPTYRLGCQDCKGALHKTTGHQKCTRDTNSSTASQKTPQPLDSVRNTVTARTTNLYKTNGKREFDIRQTEPGTTVDHQDKLACHMKAAKTSFNTTTKIEEEKIPLAEKPIAAPTKQRETMLTPQSFAFLCPVLVERPIREFLKQFQL